MHKLFVAGSCLAATAALVFPCGAFAQLPSGGLRVQGIEIAQPETSVSGLLTSSIVKNNQLTLTVQGLPSPLTVTPWPRALPSGDAFAAATVNKQSARLPQYVKVYRTLNPFGPSQRISLQRRNQESAWLSVQTGGQSGQKVLADWTVMYSADRWWLVQGTQPNSPRIYVKGVQPIAVHNAVWCFYPSAREARPEQPALLDWVLVQQSPGRKGCAV
jgi:hypothetical protein